jgi:hypothetical protein
MGPSGMAGPWRNLLLLLGCLGTALPQTASGQEPKERATLKGHTHWVFSVAIGGDGKLVASGSDPQGQPKVKERYCE